MNTARNFVRDFKRLQTIKRQNQATSSAAAAYQRIDVSGIHAWQAPGPNDKYVRGFAKVVDRFHSQHSRSDTFALADADLVPLSTLSPITATFLAME